MQENSIAVYEYLIYLVVIPAERRKIAIFTVNDMLSSKWIQLLNSKIQNLPHRSEIQL
jgi:hypothetical protein